MNKLILVEPASRLKYQKRKIQILENIANSHYFRTPSLALGVLAGLTPPDWDIRIMREPRDRIIYHEDADIVGITAVTHTVKRGYEIADEFRKRGVKVIMGGIHPTVMFNEALQHCDSVCIGEAEPVWKDVINDITLGKLKRIYTSPEPFDLKGYTSPLRKLMPGVKSFIFDPGISVEASRGCPFSCDFCSVGFIHGHKIRYRPLNNLIEEINSIESNKIFFVDNNIVANHRMAKELFKALIPLKKRWTGQATINIVKDPELLELAVDSGCKGLLIGIESVIDEGFNKYNKNPGSYVDLQRALRILKGHGIRVLAHMVFGNDFESEKSMKESLRRISDLDIVSASIGIMVPYPGTKLAMDLEKKGRILTKDWDYYDIHHLVFRPENFTTESFLNEIEKLRRNYFSIRSIMARTIKYRDPEVLGFNIFQRGYNKVNIPLKQVR